MLLSCEQACTFFFSRFIWLFLLKYSHTQRPHSYIFHVRPKLELPSSVTPNSTVLAPFCQGPGAGSQMSVCLSWDGFIEHDSRPNSCGVSDVPGEGVRETSSEKSGTAEIRARLNDTTDVHSFHFLSQWAFYSSGNNILTLWEWVGKTFGISDFLVGVSQSNAHTSAHTVTTTQNSITNE